MQTLEVNSDEELLLRQIAGACKRNTDCHVSTGDIRQGYGWDGWKFQSAAWRLKTLGLITVSEGLQPGTLGPSIQIKPDALKLL